MGVEKVEKVGAYGTEFLMSFIAHVHLMLFIARVLPYDPFAIWGQG